MGNGNNKSGASTRATSAVTVKSLQVEETQPTPPPPITDFEKIICNEDELTDGDMKEYTLTDNLACLVAKQNGKIFAIGNQCTHFGKQLVDGKLGEGYVTCPWHGACFSLETGDIEDFPGLDSLPKYNVTIDGGEVKVHYTDKSTKRMKPMSKYDPMQSFECVLVIGGGAAAQQCVESLRNRSDPFTGRIVLITKEDCRPYDRIKLSKAPHMLAEEIALRPTDFYNDADIEVMTSTEAMSLDTTNKQVKLNSGDLLGYDHLVIATGCSPKTLNFPGSNANGIFVLRSATDSNQVASQAEGKNLVVIGASFVGLEIACTLAAKAGSVTVIGNGSYPLNAMGEEIGKYVQGLHEELGVKFILNSTPDEFLSNVDGQLTHVVVAGEQIEADVCVLGVGVEPASSFLADSGIKLDSRGNVIVNEFMETNIKGVFAAGDTVSFPLNLPGLDEGTMGNIGHWQLAMALGKCAGQNIAKEEMTPLKTVPFFWTMQCGKAIRYAGYGMGYDDIIYDGEVSSGTFVAYFCKGNFVVAVATVNRDPVAACFANLLRGGVGLAKDVALTEWYKN